jgi:hypothetical protein
MRKIVDCYIQQIRVEIGKKMEEKIKPPSRVQIRHSQS